MNDRRSFYQYFDEHSGKFRPEDNFYHILLEFDIKSEKGRVSVEDAGGMADMVPKSEKQLDWLKNVLCKVEHKQVWPTAFALKNRAAYEEVLKQVLQSKLRK